MDIYSRLKDANQVTSGRESDLLTPVNEITTAIINEYEFKRNIVIFRDTEGKKWYEIPFQYNPYWENKVGLR